MTFKIYRFFIIFITIGSQIIFANEAPKAEEHGGGGAAEKPKTEIPEWVELQSRLMGIETQMLQKKVVLQKLIEEKHRVKANSPALKEIVNEMVTTHRELQKLIDEYGKESTIFKYRFPERGAKAARSYSPVAPSTLQEMEEELNLDGRLNRNLKKIRSQYKPGQPAPATEKTESEKKDTHGNKGLQDPIKSSGDSIIILQK